MLTPMEVVAHEFTIIIGMAVWTSLVNILIKYFNLPEVLPMNLVFSYACGSGHSRHIEEFTWFLHVIRILSDCGIMIIGIFAYDTMFLMYGIHCKTGADHLDLIRQVATFSFGMKVFMGVLIYISHFTLLGGWRLGWNAVCVPFIFLYNEVMMYLFPPGNPPPP